MMDVPSKPKILQARCGREEGIALGAAEVACDAKIDWVAKFISSSPY